MALTESVRALAAGTFDVARQRLELAALDIEEQGLRVGGMLALLLAAIALGSLALAGLAATIVVLFWETSRLAALLFVTVAFGVAAAVVARKLARALEAKPPLLGATISELRRDGDQIAGRP